jgi:hypothetical protein
MRRRIQPSISTFDEIEFCKEPVIGAFILRIIGFVTTKVVSFHLALAKVGDISINMRHLRFHTQVNDSLNIRDRILWTSNTWQVAHIFCWVYYKDFNDRLCWRYVGKSDVSYSIRIDNNRRRVMEFEKEIDVLAVEDLK